MNEGQNRNQKTAVKAVAFKKNEKPAPEWKRMIEDGSSSDRVSKKKKKERGFKKREALLG